jgi:hypothetical protein
LYLSLVFEVSSELLPLGGIRNRLIDLSLSDLVIPAKVGDLGAEGVGSAIKPGNVDWDNGVDIGQSSGHFSYFLEDDVMR